ncbi:MAG: hypothetical protein IKW86_03030 [Salinivirgaceae bacterium]|nr:hypothetical protein [Salinivirgaceae bacterium]
MNKFVLFVLVMASIMAACKKNDAPEAIEEEQEIIDEPEVNKIESNCIFDSNVGIYGDYKNPTLNIYVDGVFIGVWPGNQLDSAYVGATPDYGNITDTKVYVNLKPGKHSYHTFFYSGKVLSCEFQSVEKKFVVGETGMTSVLVDFAYNVKTTSDTVLDILGRYTIKVPEGYAYSTNYGDESISFKAYSDNGNTIVCTSDLYVTDDTLYAPENEYVKEFKLPGSDSVVRTQTFPNIEIIGEKGLLYYTSAKYSSGYFFLKQNDCYILLFSVNFDIANISELKSILLTVEKQ